MPPTMYMAPCNARGVGKLPKEIVVKLSIAEMDHIQWAVADRAEEVYYGPKQQYHDRAARIIRKLEAAKGIK